MMKKALEALPWTALLLSVVALPLGAGAEEPACPFPAQRPMFIAQLFFGQNIEHRGKVSAQAWRAFLADTVTPRFPEGFTVYDAYGQWINPRAHAISRDPTKVLIVAVPDSSSVRARIGEISAIYRTRFNQQSVGIITSTACAAFD
jgi:hypothetical protein